MPSLRKKWSGRFSKAMNSEAVLYGASIAFDAKLAPYDIQGSLAYARALQRAGLLSVKECRRIQQGLRAVEKDWSAGKIEAQAALEDIHTHIETALIKRVGAVGGKLHTGRSRNDQVATDLRLYCMDQLKQLQQGLRKFEKVLLRKAQGWIDVPMPGYTHLQRAQPVLFSHHLMAYVEMLGRDEARFEGAYARTSVMPLGSGALAGNAFGIDREALARDLGFAAVSRNSLDAVSDRDFAVEIAAAASLLGVHLSRLSEELILWASREFSFVELPESYCTGSSMMPQKVNPDIPELVRGKTGRLIGALMSLLTTLKGLPLAYNKDLQEDKEPLFDIFETLLPTLEVLTGLLKELKLVPAKLRAAATDPDMLATDLADWLVRHDVPFRKAHEIVGKAVRKAAENGVALSELSLAELRKLSPVFQQGVHQALKAERSIATRSAIGGTAKKNVLREIKRHQKRLG